jgi:hypothetical protein
MPDRRQVKSPIFSRALAEQSYVTADGQSVNMSWCRARSGLVTKHYIPSEHSCRKVPFLSLWGALADERSGLSFVSLSVGICLYEH